MICPSRIDNDKIQRGYTLQIIQIYEAGDLVFGDCIIELSVLSVSSQRHAFLWVCLTKLKVKKEIKQIDKIVPWRVNRCSGEKYILHHIFYFLRRIAFLPKTSILASNIV